MLGTDAVDLAYALEDSPRLNHHMPLLQPELRDRNRRHPASGNGLMSQSTEPQPRDYFISNPTTRSRTPNYQETAHWIRPAHKRHLHRLECELEWTLLRMLSMSSRVQYPRCSDATSQFAGSSTECLSLSCGEDVCEGV